MDFVLSIQYTDQIITK